MEKGNGKLINLKFGIAWSYLSVRSTRSDIVKTLDSRLGHCSDA